MPAEPTTPRTTDTVEDVAATLLTHPWITAVDRAGHSALAVVPHPRTLRAGASPGALVAEFLEHWGEVYDLTYAAAGERHTDDLDLSGWRATDTGRPLPVEHMTEWLDRTVELVRSTGGRWVLELGCGTGMLMHRLHPHVTGYVGTDVSAHAVGTLGAVAPSAVSVVQAAAHELATARVRQMMTEQGFPDGRPDCVVLNSVTQCFPDVAYLDHVVRSAVELVGAGGSVVVGDVRHSALHDHFCRWAEHAADPTAPPDVVAHRAAARAAREEELLVDPATIARGALDSGREVGMVVRAKTMRGDTELTRYRFDVVLSVDAPGPGVPAGDIVPWTDLCADGPGGRLAVLARRVACGPVRVAGIPNVLLRPDLAGAVSAHALRDVVNGRGLVLLDHHDPAMLAVAAPASAAVTAAEQVASGVRQAYEPLLRFARRRVAEEARRHLRRQLPAAADTPITVVLDGGTA
ncbi:MAG: class I SAM-dependent methyltransferase [Phycicoccus sp.]